MKKYLMLLSCAALLTAASCSQDKSADTATTTDTTTTTTTDASGTAAMGGYSDADYNSRADRISADMAAKMKLDEATKAKVRAAYYNREKRLGELHSQYTSDTTGMAAAMRDVYSDTDTEMKTVFTDPTQYSSYETSRSEYMEDRYMTEPSSMSDGSTMSTDESMPASDMSTTTTTTTTEEMSTSNAGSGSGMAIDKLKAKDAAGNKIKIKENGKVKTKVGD
jgi:hypothetical protein